VTDRPVWNLDGDELDVKKFALSVVANMFMYC